MAHNANKRKRDASDMPNMRSAPGLGDSDFTEQYINDDVTGNADNGLDFASVLGQSNNSDPSQRSRPGQSASDTATAALAQYHTMTVPASTEQAFLNQPTENGDRNADSSSDQISRRTSNFVGDLDFTAAQPENDQNTSDLGPQNMIPANKPVVGTDEWHKVRKDNHKEVERRRRETINEGINELQKIVPGCEKNKGSILARAVQFITQLKANENLNIEKWTLEKMLTEQAISELSTSCDNLKKECQRAWAEVERWKKAAQKAGVSAVELDDKAGIDDD